MIKFISVVTILIVVHGTNQAQHHCILDYGDPECAEQKRADLFSLKHKGAHLVLQKAHDRQGKEILVHF